MTPDEVRSGGQAEPEAAVDDLARAAEAFEEGDYFRAGKLNTRGLARGPETEARAEGEALGRKLAQDPVPWLVGLACLIFLIVVGVLAMGE